MIAYMPVVHCAKCGKPAEASSRQIINGRRVVVARCHGAVEHVRFAREPGEVVQAFAPAGYDVSAD